MGRVLTDGQSWSLEELYIIRAKKEEFEALLPGVFDWDILDSLIEDMERD